MAEITTIARPYAKAAFQFALEQKALDQWSIMLGFVAIVTSDEQMSVVLQSPSMTSQQKAEVIISIDPERLDAKGKSFIFLLAENDRLELLPTISELFELLKAEQEKTVEVTITTAYDLASDEADKLAKSLKNRLGREVQISSKVDKSLIGGLIVRAGDMVIDGSVRGKLAKLGESLNS
ncbi:MAG: F0F1 ATP synthase subunit delta [Pseudomonadales bacterium]|nr:F0F1 ATP synthase subunit delta [Pseudomonadales bacterium]